MNADLRYCATCCKRLFPSIRSARFAHWRAHWRIRVYWCESGHGYHVTNQEKG